MNTLQAYRDAAVLHTAIDLELFTRIAQGMDTAYKVASSMELPVRGVKLLCESLVSAGFLLQEDDRYLLAGDTAQFLVKQSPEYLDGAATALHSPEILRAYERLTETVRAGKAPLDRGSEARHPWFEPARGIIDAAAAGRNLAAAIGLPPDARFKLLDIGSSVSGWGIAIASHYPNSIIVALDSPKALVHTQSRADAAKLGTRYQNIPGDPLVVHVGFDYDVVLLSHLYRFEPDQVRNLLLGVQYALKKTGQLLIVDFFPDDALEFAGFRLNMLASTPRGEPYTVAAIQEILASCGFGSVETVDLSAARVTLLKLRFA